MKYTFRPAYNTMLGISRLENNAAYGYPETNYPPSSHPFILKATLRSILPCRNPCMLLVIVQPQCTYGTINPALLLPQKLFLELGHHV